MLVSLRIINYVLIDDGLIEFHPGLNVLTGETGAGKSIILDALSLLTGDRGSNLAVRDPSRDALVEAVFEPSEGSSAAASIRRMLEDYGIPREDDILLVKRVLSPNGRNRIFLNNTRCLLRQLREVGDCLVDIHGQNAHQSLTNRAAYPALLDAAGDTAELLGEYRKIYGEWRRAERALRSAEGDERERKRREDMLRRQYEEILAAELRAGEEAELDARLQVMRHSEKLALAGGDLLDRLNGEGGGHASLLDELDRLEARLHEMAEIDPALRPLLESWEPAVITLYETARELESYLGGLRFEPDELERMQQRRFLLRDLMSKYGSTIEEVLAYQQSIETELEALRESGEEGGKLAGRELELRGRLEERARALHGARERKAAELSGEIEGELGRLGMEDAQFRIEVELNSAGGEGLEFGPNGADRIEFLLSTIPGRPLRPLREVASGGEVSRIMLALKCAFGKADPVPSMIFDEVDAGVGGKTADAVAERLARLAADKQVICVTHLPQIASRADRNFRVEKRKTGDVLTSAVQALNGKEREAELARMIGGSNAAASKRFAKELLKSSGK